MTGSFNLEAKYRALTLLYIFQTIHRNFLIKSTGGQDSLGNSWRELSQTTKIARSFGRGERKKYGVRQYKGGMGLLTPKQTRMWKGIFSQELRRGASPSQAAKRAWGVVKSKGGKTKKDLLQNRDVPILIETHRLERSLRPGSISLDRYIPSQEQIGEWNGSRYIVGSTVPYAEEVAVSRPPIPDEIGPWIREAEQKAILQIRYEHDPSLA